MGVHHPNLRGATEPLKSITPTGGATLQCSPSSLGDGLLRLSVAPQVRVIDSHAWRGPLSWGDGLQCFGVAPHVGVMDTNAFVWPFGLG